MACVGRLPRPLTRDANPPCSFKRGEEVASRFCTTALNLSSSAFSTGKNYMVGSSRARCGTELLKDVQQVITEKLVSVVAQTAAATPYTHVTPGRKSCYPQGTPLKKEARRVRGTKDFSEQ